MAIAMEKPVDNACTRLAEILRFLAAAMEYPQRSWLTPPYWAALEGLLHEIGSNSADAMLPSYPASPEQFECLQVEHTRLFINAVPHVIAPPYGSVYLDGDGMLYGASAERAKAFYRQENFELRGSHDIPDYLGHELRFVALLLEQGREEAAELFLRQCFRPWFGSFYQRVSRESRHPYYVVLVSLIDFFTKEEEDHGS